MSFFSKMKGKKVKQVLSGGWYSGRGGHKERVKEGEYGEVLCTSA
jgi:hypothetical protein